MRPRQEVRIEKNGNIHITQPVLRSLRQRSKEVGKMDFWPFREIGSQNLQHSIFTKVPHAEILAHALTGPSQNKKADEHQPIRFFLKSQFD